LENSLFS
jgi:hypothetical protein